MAEDVDAKSVRLDAAKKAAADLQHLCSVCTTPLLRDEGALFVNEALNVIKPIEGTIEGKAANPSSHLSNETVNNALLKTEDVLRALADRISAANCQVKPSNFFSKIVRQLSNPQQHMFKDARKLLGKVLSGMAEAAHAGQKFALETPTGKAGAGPTDSTCDLPPAPLSVESEGMRPHRVQVMDNSELKLGEVIGSGPAGKVYWAFWKVAVVAAKEYLTMGGDDAAPGESSSAASMLEALDALSKEVAWPMWLIHPNLVRTFGVCLDPPLVVMECHRHGSVFEMIQKARRQWVSTDAKTGAPLPNQVMMVQYMDYFTWDRRLEMLHDVAAGMIYLHMKHYVHGDLRSQNLLVGQNGVVKINGLRLQPRQRSMQAERIPSVEYDFLNHVAPEVMINGRASAASDVYSFGTIMYELLTWQVPFHRLSKDQVISYVLGGVRPDIPAHEQLPPGTSSSTFLSNYIKLMQECWDQEPSKRPSFDRIAARLKAMVRWRMVIQRNKTLARVANKLRAEAAESSGIAPTPPPAIMAGTDGPAQKDAAGPAAAGTSTTMQDLLLLQVGAAEVVSTAGSPFASRLTASNVGVRTVHEQQEAGQELLGRPKSPLVHNPRTISLLSPEVAIPGKGPHVLAKSAPAGVPAVDSQQLARLQQLPPPPSRMQPQHWLLQDRPWEQASALAQIDAAGSASAGSLGALQESKVMPAAASDVVPAEDSPFYGSFRTDSRGPSRAMSGIPDYSMYSTATLDSLQPRGAASFGATSSTAAQQEPAAADGSALKHQKPLGDEVLNKRLGTSEEDVTEQAKRTLEAWESILKPRRISGSRSGFFQMHPGERSKVVNRHAAKHGDPLSGPEHQASDANLPQLQSQLPLLLPQLSHLRLQAPSSWQQPQLPWLQQQQWQQAALPTPTEAANASTPATDLGPLLPTQACNGNTITPQQRPTSYAAEKQLQLGLPGCTAVLARHTSNGRRVLLLQLQLWQRLQPARQAKLLQNLHGAVKQRHPHVLRLQDACCSRRWLKCVTEPCSTSLVQYIQQRGGRLSEGLSRWLFQQLVLGLDFCHRQGIAGIPVQHSLLQVVPNLPQPVLKILPVPFCSPQPKAAPALELQERIADDLQQCGLLLVTMLGGTVASAAGSQLQDLQYRVPMGVSRACQWFLADLMQQHRKALPTAASILWHPWVKQNLPRAALGLHESCLAQAQQLRQGQAAPAASLNSSIARVLQQLQQDLRFLQQQLQHFARAAQQVPQAGLLPLTLKHSLYGAGAACTAMLQALSMLQQGVVRSAGRRSTHTQVGPSATLLQLVTLQQALSAVNNSVDDFLLQLQLHQLPTQQWRQQQQQHGQQQKAAAMQLLALLLSSWRVLTAAKRAEANARHCRATANHVVVAFLCPAPPRLPRPPELVRQQQRTPIDLVQPLVLLGLIQVMIQYAWPWHRNTGTAAVGLLSLLLQLPGAVGIAVAHDRTEGSLAVHEQLQQLPAELLVLQQECVTADALSTALYAAQQGHQQLWIAGLHLQPACAGAQADSWQGSELQQQGQQQAAGKHPLMLRAQQQQQPCSLQQYQPLLKLLRPLPLSQVVKEQQSLGASQPGTAKLPTASGSSHTSADDSAAGAFSTVLGLCSSPPLLLMQQPPGGTLECWLLKQQQLLRDAAGSSSSTVSMQWARLAPWQLLLQLLTEVAEALCIMHEQADLVAHGHVHAGAIFLLQQLPDIGTGAGQPQQLLPGRRLSQLSLIGPWQQVASNVRTFRPCITAGEVLLTAAPVSPATDVYGFGILMLQLAACWVPAQHEPGSDLQLAEMRWCHKMLERTGSTFPLTDKTAATAAEVAESSWDLESSDVMPWLPQLPPAGTSPAGYAELMHDCCCVDATARPTTQHLLRRLSMVTA